MRVAGRVCETMGGHSVAQPSIILLHTPSKTDTTNYGSRDGFGVSGFLCYTSALLCQLKCIILLISEFKQAEQLVIQARNEILCSPRKKKSFAIFCLIWSSVFDSDFCPLWQNGWWGFSIVAYSVNQQAGKQTSKRGREWMNEWTNVVSLKCKIQRLRINIRTNVYAKWEKPKKEKYNCNR